MRYPILAIMLGAALMLPAAAQDAPKASEKKEDAAASPAPDSEKTWTGWIDVGARWRSNVAGDMRTYRSLVNLDEGFRLPSMDISYQGSPRSRVLKNIRLSSGNWGDPYNTLRLQTDDEFVQQSFRYSNIAYYNFLPSFANPQTPNGAFNQRSYDIRMKNFDYDFTVLPNSRFTPYMTMQNSRNDGTGITPLILQGNEYPLRNNIDWSQYAVAGGVRMNFTRAHVTVEHGYTSFDDGQSVNSTERLSGNRGSTPLLGQQLFLTNGSLGYQIEGSSRITKVLFTANPYDWVDLYGQVLYANPKTTVNSRLTADGSLFASGGAGLLFYNRGTDVVFGNAQRPHTTGSFAMELRPVSRLRIREMFETDRIKTDSVGGLEATLLKNPNLTQTLTQSYADRLETSLHRQTVEALYDFSRKLTLRGGYRYEWGDSLFRAGVLNIFGPQERLELQRHIGLAGIVARPWSRLTLNADAEASNGVKTYYRTSLQDYYRLRLQGRLQVRQDLLLTAVFNRMENSNPAQGINYDFRFQSATVGLQYMPGGAKWMAILADYTRSTVMSDIDYIVPFPFQTARSLYRDNAHTGTLMADFSLPGAGVMKPKLSFGGSVVTTAGSRPSRYYQPLGRINLPVHRNVQFFSEWRNYGFNQPFTYNFETFRTNLVMTGIRIVL